LPHLAGRHGQGGPRKDSGVTQVTVVDINRQLAGLFMENTSSSEGGAL
jgi:hypothetical protein